MQHQCSISVPEKLISKVTETWRKEIDSVLSWFAYRKITSRKKRKNTTTCSLKWLFNDVQGIPVVITRGDGTFSLQTKLNPEQSFLLSVNRQCFQLFSYFNKCSFHLPSHIRPLDAWSRLTRQPKKKPAKYAFSNWKKGFAVKYSQMSLSN